MLGKGGFSVRVACRPARRTIFPSPVAAGITTKLAVVETKLVAVEVGQTHVEAVVLRLRDNARTDVRPVFGALISVAIRLAAMMAHGFHRI